MGCKWSSGSCWAKEAVVPTGAPSQAPTASPTNAPDENGEDSVIRCADYDNNKDVCQNEANLVGVCTWNPNPPTTKLQCVPVDTKFYCNEYHGDEVKCLKRDDYCKWRAEVSKCQVK